MDIEVAARNDLINNILKMLVTSSVKVSEHSDVDNKRYDEFIKQVRLGRVISTQLALDYALRDEAFNLIKEGKVFIESSVKFVTTFTTKRPTKVDVSEFTAKYIGNEFNYSFLDNHPGIINIDKLKDIPTDYEGLMAVPPTVLEYKHLLHFNIHRVLYAPKHNGRSLYPRVVISNKVIVAD